MKLWKIPKNRRVERHLGFSEKVSPELIEEACEVSEGHNLVNRDSAIGKNRKNEYTKFPDLKIYAFGFDLKHIKANLGEKPMAEISNSRKWLPLWAYNKDLGKGSFFVFSEQIDPDAKMSLLEFEIYPDQDSISSKDSRVSKFAYEYSKFSGLKIYALSNSHQKRELGGEDTENNENMKTGKEKREDTQMKNSNGSGKELVLLHLPNHKKPLLMKGELVHGYTEISNRSKNNYKKVAVEVTDKMKTTSIKGINLVQKAAPDTVCYQFKIKHLVEGSDLNKPFLWGKDESSQRTEKKYRKLHRSQQSRQKTALLKKN